MEDEETEACQLCGGRAVAIPREAPRPGESLPAYDREHRGRIFVSGDHALLHHDCSSPQAGTDRPYWEHGEWWACQNPDRPIDSLARFDRYCYDCAHRWAQSVAGTGY